MTQVVGASAPAELRRRGVSVYEAPDVPQDRRVVNLVNGVIVDFTVEGEVPAAGLYADLDEVVSLAENSGRPVAEQSGALRLVRRAASSDSAPAGGDPLGGKTDNSLERAG